jgi:hypothetical protein
MICDPEPAPLHTHPPTAHLHHRCGWHPQPVHISNTVHDHAVCGVLDHVGSCIMHVYHVSWSCEPEPLVICKLMSRWSHQVVCLGGSCWDQNVGCWPCQMPIRSTTVLLHVPFSLHGACAVLCYWWGSPWLGWGRSHCGCEYVCRDEGARGGTARQG